MNLQQLIMYQSFCTHKNVTAVANELCLKQPTVTFHLKNLQHSLGVKLYERNGEQVTFTSAGKTLRYYSKEILNLIKETERVMNDYKENRRGELFIGASHIPANYLLPSTLNSFSQKFQDIHFNIHVETTPKIIEKVLSKELDLAIVSEQGLEHENLSVKPLVEDELVIVTPPNHPLTQSTDLKKQMKETPFILHKSGSTRQMIEEWGKKERISLQTKMELTNIESIRQMVMLGSGCSILSKKAIEKELQRGELDYIMIPNLKHRHLSLVYRHDRLITPTMQSFINELLINESSY
ncbi:LysR substrate-binding domain-containing protein [Bacillus sp. FJAT-45037]|uniref:LysR substrate-binding domain-containing protein n=1 Tax=Bacillus sp. FJAT-45037 TaxID=2011007 RepID=UPI000C2469F7|nr:LysR substrate-binding domain-containing protein [Bacillus sp. FJAT-45037]